MAKTKDPNQCSYGECSPWHKALKKCAAEFKVKKTKKTPTPVKKPRTPAARSPGNTPPTQPSSWGSESNRSASELTPTQTPAARKTLDYLNLVARTLDFEPASTPATDIVMNTTSQRPEAAVDTLIADPNDRFFSPQAPERARVNKKQTSTQSDIFHTSTEYKSHANTAAGIQERALRRVRSGDYNARRKGKAKVSEPLQAPIDVTGPSGNLKSFQKGMATKESKESKNKRLRQADSTRSARREKARNRTTVKNLTEFLNRPAEPFQAVPVDSAGNQARDRRESRMDIRRQRRNR
jgi:hypothetical protein